MDWMSSLGGFGEGVFDSVTEGVGGLVDGYVDYQTQTWAQKQANPQTQKEAEPTKGKTVEGQPIVVQKPATVAGLTTNQLLMAVGGVAALGLLLVVVRK